jgi:TPR repeat protein
VDHISATEYYRTAAEMGSQTAQEILAYQYLEGRGVLRSPVMAHAWLNVASARSRGGEQKKFLDEIEKGLTRDQLAEASRIASDLFERFKPSKEVERWEMLRELQRGESSRTK